MLGEWHEFGEVGADDHKELLEGGGLADAGDPQHIDAEVGVFEGELTLWVVGDEFADVH